MFALAWGGRASFMRARRLGLLAAAGVLPWMVALSWCLEVSRQVYGTHLWLSLYLGNLPSPWAACPWRFPPYFSSGRPKPHEQSVGIPSPGNSVRPWLSTSAVLASPWIQHFKAKQVPFTKKSEAQECASTTQASKLSACKENLKNSIANMCDTISNTARSKSSLLELKKRVASFDSSDCSLQFGNHSKSSNGPIACGFKKLKCQQPLSQMDMVMEEKYNTEQQNQENSHMHQQNEGNIQSKNSVEELKMPQTGIFEADESRKPTQVSQPRSCFAQKKQTKEMCMQMGLKTSKLSQELLIKKSDQVVPLFKECCKEAGEQSIIQDNKKAMPIKETDELCRSSGYDEVFIVDKVNLSLPSCGEEKISTQLGSKTWTWGTQGIRYRLGGSMSPLNFKH